MHGRPAQQGRLSSDADRLWQQKQRRAFWLRQFLTWHWMSSAICLIGMLLFAVTGITLNHAGQIEARAHVTARQATLPPPLTAALKTEPASAKAPLPATVSDWIAANLSVGTAGRDTEWSNDEVYVSLPRAGGDAWLSIDRADGKVSYELTDRGWIAYLNDLHKGRNTGPAWSWFIDIFAAACLVFCTTGLLLLNFHSARRPATWPMVGLGLIVPVLLLILFVHS
ncbi:MAG: PepSY-associated TM helix domain-containing protein [Xanthobacteraceae bacterium]